MPQDFAPPHRRRPLSDAKIEYARGRYDLERDPAAQGMPYVAGFKKGGKVKATGEAKVHKGEYVIKASAAKKAGPKKLAAINRAPAKAAAKKPAMRRGR